MTRARVAGGHDDHRGRRAGDRAVLARARHGRGRARRRGRSASCTPARSSARLRWSAARRAPRASPRARTCWLLEIPARAVETAAAKHPKLAEVLAFHARARLLANLTRTSRAVPRARRGRSRRAARASSTSRARAGRARSSSTEGERERAPVGRRRRALRGAERAAASLAELGPGRRGRRDLAGQRRAGGRRRRRGRAGGAAAARASSDFDAVAQAPPEAARRGREARRRARDGEPRAVPGCVGSDRMKRVAARPRVARRRASITGAGPAAEEDRSGVRRGEPAHGGAAGARPRSTSSSAARSSTSATRVDRAARRARADRARSRTTGRSSAPPGAGLARVRARARRAGTADFMNLPATDMELGHPPATWKAGEIIEDVQDFTLRPDWRSPTATLLVGLIARRRPRRRRSHGRERRRHVVDRAVDRAHARRSICRRRRRRRARSTCRTPPAPITIDGIANDPGWTRRGDVAGVRRPPRAAPIRSARRPRG